ncbi:MAG: PrsW family intramembrane metalloprotease [Chloroflexi bacterium]|nr:PrsW family intramembrane metalloprotease [Chloroflexota bacterium]
MQTQKNHWPSMLILAALGISALFLLLFVITGGIASLIDLFSKKGDPAGEMISVFAFGFALFLVALCSWYVLQKTMGREQADSPFKFPFSGWQIPAGVAIMTLAVASGWGAAHTEIKWLAWLVMPPATVCVILPPLWLFFGLGSNGLDFGPRWRVFGILGLGITLSPFVMIMLEVVVLIAGIAGGAIFLAVSQPDLLQEIVEFGEIINQAKSEDAILSLIAPHLMNATVIAALLGYVSLFVPLIEELFKPLAVWLFAQRIDSPAQGFAMGMLSGAAFALFESLNASSDGTTDWAVIVSVRAGTSLLHMTTSGLVGWGIVSAFRERRTPRLFAAYASAVALHGLWNACAVGAGLSGLGQSLGRMEWFFIIAPASVGGMAVLGVGMFLVILASNRKLRGVK